MIGGILLRLVYWSKLLRLDIRIGLSFFLIIAAALHLRIGVEQLVVIALSLTGVQRIVLAIVALWLGIRLSASASPRSRGLGLVKRDNRWHKRQW
jgi:hypothetical protein